jgi:hypothetical protein
MRRVIAITGCHLPAEINSIFLRRRLITCTNTQAMKARVLAAIHQRKAPANICIAHVDNAALSDAILILP